MEFIVYVCGTVIARCSTREEAERKLDEARHSYLALVHCRESFYIKEK